MEFTVTKEFVNQCVEHAEQYKSTIEKVQCELFEYEMIRRGKWKDYPGWAVDGVCPTLGNVDVKMIEPNGKPWWNIPPPKARNIFRQYDIIDHYFFIRADKMFNIFEAGDKVNIEILGYSTYKDVCKNIQVSKTYGYYYDTRRAICDSSLISKLTDFSTP